MDHVHVDVAGHPRDASRTSRAAARASGCAGSRPSTSCVALLGPGEVDERHRRSRRRRSRGTVPPRSSRSGGGARAIPAAARRVRRRARTCTPSRSPLARAADPRGPADQVLAAGRAGERDDDPLARLPRGRDAVVLHVALEASSTLSATQSSASSRSAREVAGPEVVGERGVDLLRRVDVAVRHAPPERLRRHVDELDLVGARGRRRRAASRAACTPVMRSTTSLSDSRCWMLTRRDHVDAGVEQLLDVLPALLVAASRARWCGRARRRARPAAGGRGSRRCPSPRTRCRGTRPSLRGTTSRSPICSAVRRAAVGLDEADDDVGAAVVAAATLVEHRERLADAGRGAEVDPKRAPGHGSV